MKIGKIVILLVCMFLIISNIAAADGIVVAFEKKEYSLLAGKTETITPVIQGTKTKGKYSYSSSDESIATVKNGQVKGISLGDVTISCAVVIGSEEYNCSYVLHVLQPVTEIYVPEKEMVVPLGAILRELPYTIIPENASNKEIEILRDGKKQEPSSDGTFSIGDVPGKGTHKYTFKTTDGSNITATLKVTIPKGAWFSVDSPLIIDDPSGVDFFYVPTVNYGATILEVNAGSTKGVVSSSGTNKDPFELLEDTPFTFHPQGMTFSFFQSVHLDPIEVGKGQYVVVSTGDKAALDIVVKRSAVYETIAYEQFLKAEEKNKSLRFQITGTVSTIDETGIYLFYDNDEAKPVLVTVPETIDISTLVQGNAITVKGIFTETSEYKTETGLTKTVPVISAEKIEQ